MSKGEWRVLYDGRLAGEIDDPTGETYTFVYVEDGKIVRKGEKYSGYTYNFKEKMKKELEEKSNALDKPYVLEEVVKSIKEIY